MAHVSRKGDTVILTLSTKEALYVTAELGGGNSYFHGLRDTNQPSPYSALVTALRVGGERLGPLAKAFNLHRRLANAARPEYDNVAAEALAMKLGLHDPALV